MTDIKVKATFRLRGVDHKRVLEKYSNNAFSKLEKLNNENVDIVDHSLNDYSIDSNTVSKFTTQSNHTMTVLMAGNVVCKDKDGNPLEDIGVCDYCRDPIKSKAIGIPVDSIYDPVTKITTYITTHKTCHFECANSLLSLSLGAPKMIGSPSYVDSPMMLDNMFKACYPGEKLNPAKPWKLHVNWGGPLDSSKFHEGEHQYYDTHCVRVVHGSNQYVETRVN